MPTEMSQGYIAMHEHDNNQILLIKRKVLPKKKLFEYFNSAEPWW